MIRRRALKLLNITLQSALQGVKLSLIYKWNLVKITPQRDRNALESRPLKAMWMRDYILASQSNAEGEC